MRTHAVWLVVELVELWWGGISTTLAQVFQFFGGWKYSNTYQVSTKLDQEAASYHCEARGAVRVQRSIIICPDQRHFQLEFEALCVKQPDAQYIFRTNNEDTHSIHEGNRAIKASRTSY